MFQLSSECLRKVASGETFNNPILLVHQVEQIRNNKQDTILRYKVSLGDKNGNTISAILSALHNELVDRKEIEIGSVLQLEEYTINRLTIEPPKAVLNIVKLKVLGHMEICKPVVSTINLKIASQFDRFEFDGCKILPISKLNCFQNKCAIRATCTRISPILACKNNNKNCCFADFVDSSGEVKIKEFDFECSKLSGITVDNIYFISNFQVDIASKKYATLSNKYELLITDKSTVELCKRSLNLCESLSDVFGKNINDLVDVIGIIKSVQNTNFVISKTNGNKFNKRDFCIFDQYTDSLAVTLWNNRADDFNVEVGQIVAIKQARVCDFNGKRLNVNSIGSIEINPDIQEAYNLSIWQKQTQNSQESMPTTSKNSNKIQHDMSSGSNNEVAPFLKKLKLD